MWQFLPLWATLYWGSERRGHNNRQKSRQPDKRTEGTLGYEHITDTHLLHNALSAGGRSHRVGRIERDGEMVTWVGVTPPQHHQKRKKRLPKMYSGKSITWLSARRGRWRGRGMFPSLDGTWGTANVNGMVCPSHGASWMCFILLSLNKQVSYLWHPLCQYLIK